MNLRLKEISIETFKSIIEYNPDAIFILSIDGIIIEINQATLKLFGYRKEEIQGIHYEELIVPEYIEETRLYFNQVLEGHSPEYETQLLHKNGSKVYLQVKNIPLWENGEIIGVFGVAKDITELRHTTDTLHEMEERMRSLFYSTGDAIDILDVNGHVVDVNPAFEKLYGWNREELIGKPLPNIPEFRYKQQEDMVAGVDQRCVNKMETFRTNKDGQLIAVDLTFSPFVDKNGQVLGAAEITRDITERKQLQNSLKESEERYRRVVEYSPKGIVIHRDGHILFANPYALKLANEDHLVGQSIYSYLHPDFFKISEDRISHAKIGKEMPRIEERIIRKDGEILDVEIGGVGIQYDGQPATLVILEDITDRKKVEKALQESEKRYKRLVELSPEPIIVHQDGYIQYANPACVKLLGAASLSDLEGKNIIDFSPPEFKGLVDERIQDLDRTGILVAPTEEKLLRLDGTLIDVEVTGISLDYNGKPSYLMMVHDLTRRRQSEEALRHSEEQYRLIAENMSDLLGVLDLEGRVLYASLSHEHVLGLSPEEYQGNLARDAAHPDDVLKVQQFFDEAVTTKENVSKEFRLKNLKNNQYLWFEARGNPIYDENGNILHILVVARNINDRKHSEEALRESEERYRLIADNITDFVCLISQDGYFKYASPSHETVLGFPLQVYEGRRAGDWVHPDDIEAIRKQLQIVLRTKEIGKFEYRFRDCKGNWIWFEAKVTPVFLENGQFEHFLIVSREIMERKMYEEKLNHFAYHDTLTGLPNRRMFKDRLNQAIKEAERYRRKLAVMFMDMDKFKQINDTFGHDVGDELLKQFAKRVRGSLRDGDTLSRLGGDEFIILLPEIQKEQDVLHIAHRIIDSFQQPWEIGEHVLHTTSSIGIAFYPENGTNRHELMKHADIALYRAKENGRNNYNIFS
ncbi:PAS domain S-box protein [Pullulanibacillus sp. KACC 23026]|uniref:PAS domain S-box protein n=1 Tax=Pullulanibacillus sp. KACC 23026 TaxID=3028315 RepID=UPI0023AFF7CA|nr:PAS domain S-box protein [Pullulanibacillus sp. KACC 23026]WEG13472.1 PAS domain S-box protein [Pullulanibacillus sp. KACC 23026]